jgi:formate dehydrogenase major subunit
MTRRSAVLDAIEQEASLLMCSADMRRVGVQAGDLVQVSSRRGELQVRVRQDDGTPVGTVFLPFAFREAAANLLTNAALDPVGKIPELKFCAVQVQVLALSLPMPAPAL